MAQEYCSRGNAGATLDVDVDVDYPIRPGSTSTEASSDNLSLKLGSKSFSIEYDGDSSEASALMTGAAQNENNVDRQKLTGSATDLTNVIQYIQSKQLDSDSGQYNGIQGWVGGSPHTSNEVSTYSNGDHSQSPSTCTMGTGTPVVKQPIMLQTLAIPNERYRHEDFADDPLLSVSKESTTGDRSPSLYPNHMASPSNNSSPLGNRRHQFTVIPMKKIPEVDKKNSKRSGNEALGLVLSALYGKLLVVMGIAFPMSEVISTYIPPSFYDGFYLYLYFGSITFMICILGNILRQKATRSVRCTIRRINTMRTRVTSTNSGVAPDVTSNDPPDVSLDSEGSCSESPPLSRLSPTLPRMKIHGINGLDTLGSGSVIEPQPSVIAGAYCFQRIHFGSFYLRMGAVAFGIGSMIYSGLEFGQYFELEPDTKCHNILIALTPSVRMIFTFMQMYFIFLNSKMTVSKVRLGSQFGLMHMIGTNLCVWLNVLVQETRHEILQFYNPDNNTIMTNHGLSRSHYGGHGSTGSHGSHVPYNTYGSYGAPLAPETPDTTETPVVVKNITTAAAKIISDFGEAIVHHRVKRGLKGPHSIYECRRTDIMGALVQNASPFLFPCTIEYSLICAAILYVMWKSIAKRQREFSRSQSMYNHHGDMHMFPGAKRSPHHYSVDCARANKGLFLGIFVLVLTIISLILFFVLITRPGYQALAILEVNITELVLYCTTTVAVLIGMCQVRELRYVRGRNLELDNILLIVAQTGSFIYNVFTIIGGHFTMKKNTVLVLMTALASLIQLLFQTLFILDASKRSAATADQARRKPGREVVTFLLVTNLAMWAINTLEKSRADSHPVQLRFYGVWAWTIITHISMPLAIFYRFHSTVCLCEIWKRAYKIKAGVVYH